MKDLLTSGARSLGTLLQTRTGFLGFGPTYGEIVLGALIAYTIRRAGEREVVREAENILAEIDKRNKML